MLPSYLPVFGSSCLCLRSQSKRRAEGLGCDVVRVDVDERLTKEQLLETFVHCGRCTGGEKKNQSQQQRCFTSDSVRLSGPDGGVFGSSLCGHAAGGAGEGVVAPRPPGRPLPQSGHPRPVFAAPPQHWCASRLSDFGENKH